MSETETNWRKKTLFFIIVISALRLAVLPAMNLMPQDAYYWQYAKHPSIGYFDHPPMHAFTAILTTSIFGDNAFGIRLGPWLYSLGILILIYNLTRRIYGERGAFWAVILAGVTPLFSIGSGILTPDPPLLFFWTLAIYLGWRTITENK
ncbi:glycosyltransferase family 39 protein, partial [bacterium]|nr:glycosyltransferase family 39 protein [bacterium]